MKTYRIYKEFANHEECEKWEKENLTKNDRQMYNDEYIMCVMHKCDGEKEIITEIWTC